MGKPDTENPAKPTFGVLVQEGRRQEAVVRQAHQPGRRAEGLYNKTRAPFLTGELLPPRWSSYFAVSVGGCPLEVLKNYIKNQSRPGRTGLETH